MGASSTISMLNLATYLVIFLIIICIGIYFIIANKKTKTRTNDSGKDKVSEDENQQKDDTSKNQNYGKFQGVLTRESIKDFMEFDEVVDNMIVRKNNSQYVMVLQCNGVNYEI